MKRFIVFAFLMILGAKVSSAQTISTYPGPVAFEKGYLRMDGEKITKVQYLEYARQFNRSAYDLYQNGKRMSIIGAVLTPIGIALGVGCGFIIVDGYQIIRDLKNIPTTSPAILPATLFGIFGYVAFYGGCLGCVCAAGLLATGITFLCIGSNYTKKSVNAYNRGGNFNYALNLQASQNGLGLALNF